MAKAVLLIDMPETCFECDFCRGLNACRLKQCIEKDGPLTVYTVDKQILDRTKPAWCPLEPLPDLMTPGDMFNNGWNAFRFAIGGEAEE